LILIVDELEMRHKLPIVTLFIFAMCQAELNAQETVSTSGGTAFGSTGSVSYTVGQMVYTTISEATGSVVQGVQQTYEISIEMDPDNANDIELTCDTYPNPVTDFLTLEIKNYIDEKINYYLYDVNGRLVRTDRVEMKKTFISMYDLLPETYYLKVEQKHNKKASNSIKYKVFKIIKDIRR
jgi:hypothetical protein